MNAAGLVQLAAARGIDLNHVAGVASNIDGVARKRVRTDVERKAGIPQVRETARGRETRTYRQPAWTIADLGQAAKGLGPVPWAAALYSFAGSKQGYWALHSALADKANRLSRRDHWAPRVLGAGGVYIFFREQLASLVLTEDADLHWFAGRPNLYADFMGVDPEIWEKTLLDPFLSLKAVYASWLSVACGVIGRSIREPD